MFKGHSIVKLLSQILVVACFLILNLNAEDAPCSKGKCIPAENCPGTAIEGFDNFCNLNPLKVCCSNDNLELSPSALACNVYSQKLCNRIPLHPHVSDKYKYPFMVLVGRLDSKSPRVRFDCGGTLIHERYVLTAGNCIRNNEIFVRLGGQNLTNGILIKVKKAIPYDCRNTGRNIRSAIGLLELERSVEFNEFIMPACLPTTSGLEINNFIASGWGYIDQEDTLATTLKEMELTQMNPQMCSNAYSQIKNDFNICTGRNEGVAGICNGDSGGSLTIKHPQNCLSQVFGVIENGLNCGSTHSRGINARVFPYLKWIEQIVWPTQI